MNKYILITFLLLYTSVESIAQLNKNSEIVIENIDSPKIIYRGINNKIKISVPKVDSIQVIDSHTGLLKVSKQGYYSLNVTTEKAPTKKLEIKSYVSGINIKSEFITFHVLDITRPKIKINDNLGHHLKMYFSDLKDAKIEIYFPNSSFLENYFKIIKYKIKIGKTPTTIVNGNHISKELYMKILQLSPGEEVQIFDVRAKKISGGFSCGLKSLKSISIELINKL